MNTNTEYFYDSFAQPFEWDEHGAMAVYRETDIAFEEALESWCESDETTEPTDLDKEIAHPPF
ncbi:hypothetical protein [Crocosphaera chwakensis]|uniref:Uncharacterized protein n=1 Tax=Crocosphaera chwakensis CCY0110 TaxID=391612 RepID=A3IS55_9CHRO|nr:hypothetical protein [Crocosphaera chwakensis]EAZ90733.1 hypothetical protein CY0110_32335 [Crocosphaera chwakensis CCY0110]